MKRKPEHVPTALAGAALLLSLGTWCVWGLWLDGNVIKGRPLFGILRLKHHMQGVEHGAGDVPVEIVGLEVQGVGVGEKARQFVGDGAAGGFGQADIDVHGGSSA